MFFPFTKIKSVFALFSSYILSKPYADWAEKYRKKVKVIRIFARSENLLSQCRYRCGPVPRDPSGVLGDGAGPEERAGQARQRAAQVLQTVKAPSPEADGSSEQRGAGASASGCGTSGTSEIGSFSAAVYRKNRAGAKHPDTVLDYRVLCLYPNY